MRRQVYAEALGALLLTAAVVGSGIMGERLAGGNAAIALLANTLATVAALAALIATLGPISGAHFNPVVTLNALFSRQIGGSQAAAYIAAQFAGCCAGALLANAMFDQPVLEVSSHVRGGAGQWLSELVATAGLVFVAFRSTSVAEAARRVPLWIGAAYWFTASTSFANPAITVARSLTDTFAGIRPADAPAFIAAQCVGAVAGISTAARFCPAAGARMITTADSLNRDCECIGTDVSALRRELDADFAAPGGADPGLAETHPHLFSEIPVFVEPTHMRRMQRVIEGVERVVSLPAYRERVLRGAPSIAINEVRAAGVFLGFDFHIAPDGPKLIEINTNAGGALLNIAARGAQVACCPPVSAYLKLEPGVTALEAEIFSMFMTEWRLVRGVRALKAIAIVDDAPEQQYLYPEFRLFERLFAANGLRAFVADAAELEFVDGCLKYRREQIDLVYNRTTDFYFTAPTHAALRQAYQSGAAVITPHPRAHALYSNKKNLCVLSDADELSVMGVAEADREALLNGIPTTLEVRDDAAKWWAERKQWFFKPAQGFGSRGTYRGDKLTRGVFTEIMRGGYVAQKLIPPSERRRATAEGPRDYKLDVRNYVYRGNTQMIAARLYQGQTTNFRTAGGGFAPVYGC